MIIDICSRRDWVIPLKAKSDAYQALKDWKVGVELQSGKKIRRARSDNAPELLKATNDWKTEDGVLAQSTTIASSHQNGPAERSIQTVEFDMRAMLEEAQLPLEFWDEAAEADSYMRNRTATGPVIDNQKTCPMKAFTGETPSIDHIRKWGSKCFYYVDKKTIPANERHDKLVNPGRIGVFMGYSESTTKHFKVYSPERGSTIMSSRVVIKESSKGGSVDLRLRNCVSGPQGTLNVAPDRKARGRPRLAEEMELDFDSTAIPEVQLPSFTPPTNVPRFTEEDMVDYAPETVSQAKDATEGPRNLDNCEPQAEQTDKISPGYKSTEASQQSTPDTVSPVESGNRDVQGVTSQTAENNPETEARVQSTGVQDNKEPSAGVDYSQLDQDADDKGAPRYFTRSSRKRSIAEPEEQGDTKRIRAMIAQMIARNHVPASWKDLSARDKWASDEIDIALAATEIAGIKIPKTYKEATTGPNGKQWNAAMAEEMLSLYSNETFREVIAPEGSNLVSCKWVYTVKTTVDGNIERFKARLVARGFSQVQGMDYDQTFAPTVRMDTLRMFLAVVARENLECHQYDIKNAFTESELKEKIYLKIPEGVNVRKGFVWQAMKSLYGLKQAARDWNRLMKDELVRWGFTQSAAPCMFVNKKESVKILVYVDDIVAAAKSTEKLDWFYKKLSSRFKAKNLGEISKILGARVTRDRESKSLEIDQEQYLQSVLDKFGITHETFKPRQTPANGYENLRPANDNDERINVTEYQQAIGSLMYAMIFTRPDIAFILGKLSQFMSDPAIHHGHGLKALLRYTKSTIKTKIRYGPGGEYSIAVLYSDADWASDKFDRKSVSGSVTMFYGGPISWASKKQRSVATSSCESEYMALAACAKQGQWFAQVFRELGYPQYIGKDSSLVQMLGDNQGAIALTKNAHLNERSKHIDIAYHFVRDLSERGRLKVDYIPTGDMIADGMTKPLDSLAFEKFKDQMGLTRDRYNRKVAQEDR
ncbi:related to TY4B TY4B protein [Rhynchosporium agropyri]|uniref:Related to TY4B TY4B protein n=1 Tax=Rhynchosporium agropyri TaxID=914238 RepID=A0A1E1K2U2_9HELO|nr:related to TY4B TY4B protein [Rhynchosporium agropyri]